MEYLLGALGFAFLIGGADLLVKGSAAIAFRLGVSDMVVGLTIVAFGTSLPELVVSVSGSLQGHPDLAITNVIGSNVVNVLGILGVAALIRSLPVNSATVLSEIPFSLAAVLLVGFLANATLFSTRPALAISRIDGVILLFFFALFMAYVYMIAKTQAANGGDERLQRVGLAKALIYVAIGLVGLFAGGEFVVRSAIAIAQRLGVSEAMIGLTIVAGGTSLPELFASAVAAYRGRTDLAVGNVIGSNIFNLLWILGVCALITELPFNVVSNFDLVVVMFATTLVLVAITLGRRAKLRRAHGLLFVMLYIGYIWYVVGRG